MNETTTLAELLARAEPAGGASRPSATLVALIALTGYVARLVVVFVHEVIGHGVVGILAGGMFYDLFVSPVEGSANVVAPDGLDVPVLVGGSLAGLDLDGDSSYVWSRPADLSAIDSFPVLIGRR